MNCFGLNRGGFGDIRIYMYGEWINLKMLLNKLIVYVYYIVYYLLEFYVKLWKFYDIFFFY